MGWLRIDLNVVDVYARVNCAANAVLKGSAENVKPETVDAAGNPRGEKGVLSMGSAVADHCCLLEQQARQQPAYSAASKVDREHTTRGNKALTV
jgi:hypothetical protein